MFDRLGRAHDGRVEHLLVGDLSGQVVGLLDEPVDRRAFDPLWLLPEHPENLIEPPDLLLRLFEMVFEALAEVPVGRFVD